VNYIGLYCYIEIIMNAHFCVAFIYMLEYKGFFKTNRLETIIEIKVRMIT